VVAIASLYSIHVSVTARLQGSLYSIKRIRYSLHYIEQMSLGDRADGMVVLEVTTALSSNYRTIEKAQHYNRTPPALAVSVEAKLIGKGPLALCLWVLPSKQKVE